MDHHYCPRSHAIVWVMNKRLSRNLMLVLTIAYGVVVAVLAALDSGALGAFAAAGGIAVGALWVAFGMRSRQDRSA